MGDLSTVATGIGFPEFPNGHSGFIIKFRNSDIAELVFKNKKIKAIFGGRNYYEISRNLLEKLIYSEEVDNFINICNSLNLSITIVTGHGHGDTGFMNIISNQEKDKKYKWENYKELEKLDIEDYKNVDVYCDFFG